MAAGPHAKETNGSSGSPSGEAPCSAATALKLVARFQLTEAEAQALLNAPEVTDEEILDAEKVDIHALAHAFVPTAVDALVADEKFEMQPEVKAEVVSRSGRVRVTSSACDKVDALRNFAWAAAKLDGSYLQGKLNDLVPQLKARARANTTVRTTYSPFLAYQHSRYPGRRGHPATPAPAGAEAKPKDDAQK